ncbi:LCP family protein [Paenibacillus yanchengensis]|uniref:LCP family protein n=1 Tax=Paenibacillus yanchengensis TaxID=2035833 RepID=A0ABW4YP12_9BACL
MNKKKWIISISAAIIVLGAIMYVNRGALATLGFDWLVAGQIEKGLEKTYQPIEGRKPPVTTQVTSKKQDPLSVLLLGIDQRKQEVGRADTMLYAVVRPSEGNVLLISIPRDAYVDIVGYRHKDKINHSFAFGGAGMTMDTIEELFGQSVHHYASINFEGFKQVIDELGGIALPIDKDIVNKAPGHDYFFIKGGQSQYNGTDALNFVRYREDAGGDMNRTERNQQFLKSMMDRASEMNQWVKIPEMIKIMGDNFQTDMRPEKLVDLAQIMLQSKQRNIYNYTVVGEGRRLTNGGPWYFFLDDQDVDNVSKMIENWLDPNTTEADLILPENYTKDKQPDVQSFTSAANETE